jgi:thiosulfate reductase cytochrome b subunit
MSSLPDEVAGRTYKRHPLAVRVMHWINAVAIIVLLMSGLQIFNAHPALYWGKSSYTGAGPILEPGPFPGWLTLPGPQWLAMGRRWHLFFAWVLVVNGAAYVVHAIVTRHLARDLKPSRTELRSIGKSLREHLKLRHPVGDAATRYNVLQKLAYLFVMFILLPVMVLMGVGMSPSLDTLLTGWVDLFGGRQSIRTLHFAGAVLLAGFLFVHVFEVIVTGAWNNLRSMLSGRYTVPREKQP